ncbi:hypothetical protein D3C86_1818800 [compost metagenome]
MIVHRHRERSREVKLGVGILPANVGHHDLFAQVEPPLEVLGREEDDLGGFGAGGSLQGSRRPAELDDLGLDESHPDQEQATDQKESTSHGDSPIRPLVSGP